jgi:nucleoside-diphosphate-sugar epimerase
MAILVTGAFGCIGAWVMNRLLAAGERPVVYDLGDDPWRMRIRCSWRNCCNPPPWN